MKTAEIRKMKTTDLMESVTILSAENAELRRRIHMGETTNVRALRTKRKDLARMLTIMSEQLSKENV